MAVRSGKEAGAGIPPELSHVRHGNRCVSLHPSGSHLGLRLFPCSHSVRNIILILVSTPGQLGGPTDQEPSLPYEPGAEMLPDVLSMYPPETLPSHSGGI